jgi:Holliday junction resolvase RusA-like endonuclease
MKLIMIVRGHPRPQPRPVFTKGRVISTANPLAAAWKAKIKSTSAQINMTIPPGPVSCTMWFKIPHKDPARHGKAHTQVPDLDNLAKLALDAIQDTGLLANDSQVARLTLDKTWSDQADAGLIIELEPWTPKQSWPGFPVPGWIN